MFSALTVFPVLAFIFTLYYRSRETPWNGRMAAAIVNAGFVGLVMFGVSTTIGAMTPAVSTSAEYDKVRRIVALSASQTVKGSFFLGSGRIEGRPVYFFYFETPDGGKKLDKLEASRVTLYEEDRTGAFIAKVKTRREPVSHTWVFDFFVPRFLRGDGTWGGEYSVHIPRGSIKEEFHLDLPR